MRTAVRRFAITATVLALAAGLAPAAGARTVRYGPFLHAPTSLESLAGCISQEAVYDSGVQSSG